VLLLCAGHRFYTPAWQPVSSAQAGSRHSGGTQVAALRGLALSPVAATTNGEQQQQQRRRRALQEGSSLPGAQQKPESTSSTGSSSSPHVLQGSVGDKLDTTRLFYSFEMGGVHFLMLDTESPSEPGSPQGQFVAADLAKVRGTTDSLLLLPCRCCCCPVVTDLQLSLPLDSDSLWPCCAAAKHCTASASSLCSHPELIIRLFPCLHVLRAG
jgi:hypothetical protein